MDDSEQRINQLLRPLEPARLAARGASFRKGLIIGGLFLVWFPLLFAGAFGGAWLGAWVLDGKPWLAVLGFVLTPIAWSVLMFRISQLALTQPRLAKLGYEMAFREKVVHPLLAEAFPDCQIEPVGFLNRERFSESGVMRPPPDQYEGRALVKDNALKVAAVTADQNMGIFGWLETAQASPQEAAQLQLRTSLVAVARDSGYFVWLRTGTREAFAAHVLVENSAEDLKADLDAYRQVITALRELTI